MSSLSDSAPASGEPTVHHFSKASGSERWQGEVTEVSDAYWYAQSADQGLILDPISRAPRAPCQSGRLIVPAWNLQEYMAWVPG